MTILQLHPKHGIRKRLQYCSRNLNLLFVGHRSSRCVKIKVPPLVTATVCSKCADLLWSFVNAVQPSSATTTSGDPAFTIGSIARTIPSWILGDSPETT